MKQLHFTYDERIGFFQNKTKTKSNDEKETTQQKIKENKANIKL